jgi:PAS domain S-box-containing protein
MSDEHAGSAAALDALFRGLPVGLMIFDTDLRYARVNDALLAMDGGTLDERHGRTVGEVHPDLAPDVDRSLRHVLETGEPILGERLEGELRRGSGKARVWRMSYVPIDASDGSRCGVGAIVEDITQIEVMEDAARRDRARLHQSQEIATTLQRSMMPRGDVASVEGLEVSGRYLPATDHAEIGGDWYDVIRPRSGGVGLVMGDVMGRGVHAAAVMGQIRTAVRAYAKLGLSPGELLGALDELIVDVAEAELTTCIYGVLDPSNYVLRFASAGHMPPLVARVGGVTSSLECDQGPPLGAGVGEYREHVSSLPEDSILALYTDGLVESHRYDLDFGIRALAGVLSGDCASLDKMCDEAIESMARVGGGGDDTALLLVRRRPEWRAWGRGIG